MQFFFCCFCFFFTLQAPATLRLCRQQLFIRQFPPEGVGEGRRAFALCCTAAGQKAERTGGQIVACRASEQIFIMSSRVESTLTTTFTCVWYIVSLIVVVLVAAAVRMCALLSYVLGGTITTTASKAAAAAAAATSNCNSARLRYLTVSNISNNNNNSCNLASA